MKKLLLSRVSDVQALGTWTAVACLALSAMGRQQLRVSLAGRQQRLELQGMAIAGIRAGTTPGACSLRWWPNNSFSCPSSPHL